MIVDKHVKALMFLIYVSSHIIHTKISVRVEDDGHVIYARD
jgi:hypothetical protein